MAKILIALQDSENAVAVCKKGLEDANKSSPFYAELKKKFDAYSSLLKKSTDSEACGISTLPILVFQQVFALLDPKSQLQLACTQKFVRSMCFKSAFDVKEIQLGDCKSVKSLAKTIKTKRLLKNKSTIVLRENTPHFLKASIEFMQANPSHKIQISRLNFQVNILEYFASFHRLLQLGLASSLKHLSITLESPGRDSTSGLFSSLFSNCELKSFSISDLDGLTGTLTNVIIGKSCKTLETLYLHENANARPFIACNHLKVLIAPMESNLAQFTSDDLQVVNARFTTYTDTIRPFPIRHLKLSNAAEPIHRLDISQYSYMPLLSLLLESVQFSAPNPIFNPNWQQLQTLRLNRVLFQNPQLELKAILSQAKNLRVLELTDVALASYADFSASESGAWLIQFLSTHLCYLEHLILRKIQLGPSAITLLIKCIKERKFKNIRIFGLIDIALQGMAISPVAKGFYEAYPNSYLLTTTQQMQMYNQEYNLFETEYHI